MSPVALSPALSIDDVAAATSGTAAGAPPSGATVSGVSIDSRTILPGELFVAIRGPRFDGHDFLASAAARGAAAAVVSTDVPAPPGLPLVRVADTTRALGDLAHHVRTQAGVSVVGITGSVGKTTTKDMTAALLTSRGAVLKTEGNLNNQFGLPLTLLRLRPEHTAVVLEMGMSAPGEIRALSRLAAPDVAVITRVAPVHLEFFPSVEAIARAKAEILEGLAPSGTAVLNGDDPRVRELEPRPGTRVVRFGRDRRHDVSAENWRGTAFGMRFDMRIAGTTVDVALPLAGTHFVENFLAAAATAWVLGVPPQTIGDVATGLRPARHRGEVLRLGEGVVLIDDSYNSSPEALAAAVTALSLVPGHRRVAVLGDMLELGPTAPAFHRASGLALAGRVDAIVGVGALAREILAGAREGGLPSSALVSFDDAAAAAAAVLTFVRPGDAVLVKGSRGVHLESVVDAIAARFGGAPA